MKMLNKKVNNLELYIDEKKISSSTLKKAINSFYNFVEEITNNVTGKKNAIEWDVEVKGGSAHFINHPSALEMEYQSQIPSVYYAISTGINTLTTQAERPSAYSDFALEHLRDLLLLKQRVNMKILMDEQELPTSVQITENINEILGYKEEAFGSIEGKLKTISSQRGLKVVLYERVTDTPIKCYIEDDMLKQALSAFDKKVYVFGLLRYNRHGEPVSINVKQIEEFKDQNLPTFKDIYGLLK